VQAPAEAQVFYESLIFAWMVPRAGFRKVKVRYFHVESSCEVSAREHGVVFLPPGDDFLLFEGTWQTFRQSIAVKYSPIAIRLVSSTYFHSR
jgi:hypothetical protein